MRAFWEALPPKAAACGDFLKLREKVDELGCDVAKR